YRHGYDAGNHADLLKHWVQVQCIQYLKQKDKPIFYIDTHARAGLYSLVDGFATKNAEAKKGIGHLWAQRKVSPVFDDYLQAVHAFNDDALKNYPGSPAIAAHLLRENDRLRLVEMHNSDVTHLEQNLGGDARVKIISGDGFEQL